MVRRAVSETDNVGPIPTLKAYKWYTMDMGILDNLEAYIDLGDIQDLDLTEDIDKEDI